MVKSEARKVAEAEEADRVAGVAAGSAVAELLAALSAHKGPVDGVAEGPDDPGQKKDGKAEMEARAQRLLKASTAVLLVLPEHPIAWNARKVALQRLMPNPVVVKEELDLGVRFVQVSPKSYNSWHHRKWVIEQAVHASALAAGTRRRLYLHRFRKRGWSTGTLRSFLRAKCRTELPHVHTVRVLNASRSRNAPVFAFVDVDSAVADTLLARGTLVDDKGDAVAQVELSRASGPLVDIPLDLEAELRLTAKLFRVDSRNFHCWCYRRFVRSLIPDASAADEAAFAGALIDDNFSNYSAWHQRALLLPEDASEQMVAGELELVQSAFFTEPGDSSAYFYFRHLLDHCTASQVAEQVKVLTELVEVEPTERWPHMALVETKRRAGCSSSEVAEYIEALVALDPQREQYYREAFAMEKKE